jgi:hypothetical protein
MRKTIEAGYYFCDTLAFGLQAIAEFHCEGVAGVDIGNELGHGIPLKALATALAMDLAANISCCDIGQDLGSTQ